ncbi:MAG: chemotaxis protein CheW [Chloroflexota bacterium]
MTAHREIDPTHMTLQPADYQTLEALVFNKTGLKIDKHRHREIEQTLSAMISAANLSGFQALRQALVEMETSAPLWQQLLEHVTVGETYFFRDIAQCGALESGVLPELIANIRGQIAPVFDLAVLLSAPGASTPQVLIVAAHDDLSMAFYVDAVGDAETILTTELQPFPGMLNGAYLRGVLPNGTALLNVEAILNDPTLIVDETVSS